MLGFGGVKNISFPPFLPKSLSHSRQGRRELKQHLLNAYHMPITMLSFPSILGHMYQRLIKANREVIYCQSALPIGHPSHAPS